MTKISVPKFPLYEIYFLKNAPKTNLKPILGAKIGTQKFCTAGGGWDF